MKRIVAKLGSLLLAGALLLAAAPVGVLASSQEELPGEESFVYHWSNGEEGYALRETQDTLGGGEEGYTSAQTFLAPLGSYDDGSFYGQLTARQKAVYNAIDDILLTQIINAAEVNGYAQVAVRVDEFYNIELSGSVDASGVFQPDNASQGLYRALYTDICAAITALRYDRADALWLSDMRYGVNWVSQDGSSVLTRNVVLAFRLKYGGQELELYERQMASARTLASYVNTSADMYHQVRQVYDLLAAQNSYNYDAAAGNAGEMESNLSHQAYSGLVARDEYEPVCDGYAKAVKVVCDLLEIPCVLVSSDTHMWNNVKMDDGDWYNLDLTWDDTGDTGAHDYFLVGSQTQINGVPFNQLEEHAEINPWQESQDLNHVDFRYPTKNRVAYAPQEGGYEPLRFPDVKRSAWYYNYVESAAEMGLFMGDDNGFFLPEDDITRAMFVQVLYNAFAPEDYVPAANRFTDVKTTDWFYNAVNWAAEKNVVAGFETGAFRPNASITREQMCVILVNYVTRVLYPEETEESQFRFPDDGKISSWAKEAVYWCHSNGLVSGDDKGYFNPTDNATRAEAASVYVRYVAVVENIPTEPPVTQPEDPSEEGDSSTPEEGESSTPEEGVESSQPEGEPSQPEESSQPGEELPSDSSEEPSSSTASEEPAVESQAPDNEPAA